MAYALALYVLSHDRLKVMQWSGCVSCVPPARMEDYVNMTNELVLYECYFCLRSDHVCVALSFP